ncbi:C4-dicarboxylate ABC transporter [Tetragenococcus halophilus subsp. flandriensis]|uniref:TDT family transporter n=1 Tax=Tetragenococcus halophilus TaxID=51669 RepID=UPI0023E9D215|nr:TDT family transporter [Tetragenococcus halophilus]GMA07860.1 C4-dicarboxylate ABC transporter [Tetragenococcus halophilus subsp. flandriensis]
MQKLPLPIAGVALAFLTWGNILKEISSVMYIFCGIIASLILALIIIKLFTSAKLVRLELTNPIIATSFATFPMALIVFSTYLIFLNENFAKFVWLTGLALHFILLIFILNTFVRSFTWEGFCATYFIPFVGFVVASVTASVFAMLTLGKILFYLGLVFFAILLLPVLYRIFVIKKMSIWLQPTNMIIAAPANLCLAGYLSSFLNPSVGIVSVLLGLSLMSTFSGYYFFMRMKQQIFFPTFSAATFPFAISALATKKAAEFFIIQGYSFSKIFAVIADIQLILAIFLCIYILIRYSRFLFIKEEKQDETFV